MASASEVLAYVAAMDAALLPCLPARELQAADRSSHPSLHVDVERHTRDFMEAANRLQLSFLRVGHQFQPSREQVLRKEIAALEAEIAEKDELVERHLKLVDKAHSVTSFLRDALEPWPATQECQGGSVSRHQVVMELLRPSSRKGKEVVESLNLKLQVQGVGRNPICVVNRGKKDGGKPQVKFLCTGQKDWLIGGDKISLSIKRPFFYELRLEGRSTPHSGKATVNTRANSNGVGNAPEGENHEHAKFATIDEEEGIAEAVARRQRRKLETEKATGGSAYGQQHQKEILGSRKGGIHEKFEETKVASHEQQNVQTGASVENGEQPLKKQEEVHPQRNRSIRSVDPVTEFGFIVDGSEFSAYEKQSKANKSLWRPEIGQNKGIEDDSSGDEQMIPEGGGNHGRTGVRKQHISDAEGEWGGYNEARQDRRKIGEQEKGPTRMATRRNKPKSTTSKGDNSEGPSAKPLKKVREDSEEYSDDSAGSLEDFIVDDEDPSEEDNIDEDEEDEHDAGASRKVGRKTAGQSQKPECKYGSKCYRKNAEHRAEFYHPNV